MYWIEIKEPTDDLGSFLNIALIVIGGEIGGDFKENTVKFR